MAREDSNLQVLLNQALIELGGDPTELGPCFKWDPQNQRHQRILTGLGDRMSPMMPLRLIYEKKLTTTDVKRHHNRLVIGKRLVEESIFRCLTLDQRHCICNKNVVSLVGHDPNGRKWDLKFKLWKQESNDSMTYVLLGQWGRMVSQNGWKTGDQLSIWGFPYAGVMDGRWQFGPDHGYDQVHFVFNV